jgi:pimeloyl-ACP methyl ester carboxylesterase
MNRITYSVYPLSIFLSFIICANLYGQTAVGHWQGKLEVNGQSIPLIFHIQQEDGNWVATFDSPDQMVYGVAFDKIEIKAPNIRLEVSAAKIVYLGKLQEGGEQIVGEWLQGGMAFPLALTNDAEAGPKRPQTPQGPFPYDVETVEFANKGAGINLAGTLTLPANRQNCPAVVLISGSGPQDRDATVFNHKSFWVMADYFTRQGMVVLRVDDRGVGESGGTFAGATSADFATDVAAAVHYLQKHPRVDANKVGLLGHSEGGLIAPMVASTHQEVAFVVMLAGPAYAGRETLKQQNYDITLQKTQNKRLAKKQAKALDKIYTAVLDPNNKDKSTTEILALLKKDLAKLSAKDKEQLGWTEVIIRNLIAQLRTPWLHYFLKANPADYLQKVSCPVLAINGNKDLQVHVNNLKGIEKALKKGKNPSYKIQAFQNLNHLLQTSETGAIEEYVEIEETISPKVLEAIDEWWKMLDLY